MLLLVNLAIFQKVPKTIDRSTKNRSYLRRRTSTPTSGRPLILPRITLIMRKISNSLKQFKISFDGSKSKTSFAKKSLLNSKPLNDGIYAY